MTKKMFVIGAYGCGNCGDDAILQSICELFEDWEIWATNGNYCNVSDFLPVQTVRCRLNEGFSFSVLMSMIRDSFVMLYKIAKCDVLLYGGGSLIHDLTVYNLPFLYFWHLWAKLLRKKVFYFSIGVGPLDTKMGKWLSRKVLRSADGVFVRDQRGYEICHALGVPKLHLSADAAFAVAPQKKIGREAGKVLGMEEKSYFCVTASQWFRSQNFWRRESMDFENEIQMLVQCIEETARALKQPAVFVPTVMHDYALGKELEKRLEGIDFRVMPKELNCKEMASIIENASFLLGVRMHSLIFAARGGVPLLAIVYDEKVRQMLMNLHCEEVSVPMEEMNPAKAKEVLAYIYIGDMERHLLENTELLKQRVMHSKDDMLSALEQRKNRET